MPESAIEQGIAARSLTAHEMAGISRLWMAIGNRSYVKPAYVTDAEARFNELLGVDPTNVNAHQWLSDLAKMRSDWSLMDTTALSIDDDVNTTKSSALWKSDPAHFNAAIDALGQAIEEQRIVAYELDPDDLGARMALANLYVDRMGLLYYHLPVLQQSGDQAALERDLDRIGDDMQRVHEATDALRSGSTTGSRLRTIQAWSAFVQAMEYETTRILFYETDSSDADTTDDERAQATLDEWSAAIDQALAVVEAEPLNGPDEKDAASYVYLKKSLILLFDGENDAAKEPQATFVRLQTEIADYYRERSQHNQTLCADMREVERGDELTASGSYGPADDAYRAALELNPGNAHALAGLSYALYHDGDVPGAIDAARQATAAYPDDPLPWARLGLYALASGDAVTRDEAYGQFLSLIAKRPSQERMALAKQAIVDLQDFAREQPQHGAAVLELLPRWQSFLDGISDAGDAYQYPQLYSELGELALLAGDADAANDLLQHGIDLDTHQPIAKVWLAMAALVQAASADAEIQSVVDELNDPLWAETEGVESFGWDDLVALANAEIDGFLKARPEHRAVLENTGERRPEHRAIINAEIMDSSQVTIQTFLTGGSMTWPVQEARQKFSELVDCAVQDGSARPNSCR